MDDYQTLIRVQVDSVEIYLKSSIRPHFLYIISIFLLSFVITVYSQYLCSYENFIFVEFTKLLREFSFLNLCTECEINK